MNINKLINLLIINQYYFKMNELLSEGGWNPDGLYFVVVVVVQ